MLGQSLKASPDLDPRVGHLGLCLHRICHCSALIVGVGPGSCVLPESCHTPFSPLSHSPLECKGSKACPWAQTQGTSLWKNAAPTAQTAPLPGLSLSTAHAELAFLPPQKLGSCSAHFPSLRCGSSQGASPVVFPPLCLALSWAIAEKYQKKRLNQTNLPSKADILELLWWWKKRLKLLFKMRIWDCLWI